MKARQLADRIGATVLTPEQRDTDIERVYAADRISDLLDKATNRTLLVTNLIGSQVIRLAELMEVPAICFLNGQAPPADALAEVSQCPTVFLSSPDGMFETCGRLYLCMNPGSVAAT